MAKNSVTLEEDPRMVMDVHVELPVHAVIMLTNATAIQNLMALYSRMKDMFLIKMCCHSLRFDLATLDLHLNVVITRSENLSVLVSGYFWRVIVLYLMNFAIRLN